MRSLTMSTGDLQVAGTDLKICLENSSTRSRKWKSAAHLRPGGYQRRENDAQLPATLVDVQQKLSHEKYGYLGIGSPPSQL